MPKTVIPTGADELQEMLGDPAKMRDLFKDPEGFKEFIGNYANSQMEARGEIAQQVREETQRVLAEMVKGKPGELPSNFNPIDRKRPTGAGKGALYNKKAPGASLDEKGLFRDDYATLFQAISPQAREGSLRMGAKAMEDLETLKKIQMSYGTTVPADGGFLVPEQLRSDLMMLSLESSVVRNKATVIPMETARVGIPYVDSTTNSGSVLGGLQFYWTEEGAALTEGQSKFGQVVLDANKLTGFVAAPNELVADASGFGAFLDQALPRGIAFTEDYAFFNGSGVGQPLGFINNAAAIIQTAISGQGASTIVWENVIAMYARMLPSSLNSAEWYCSPDVFPQLATMALAVGTGGAPVWLSDGTQTPRLSLLGRPVNVTEKAAALGTTGDLTFADLSYYLVGDRQTWQVEASRDYLFGSDKTAYRIIERVDGRPWIQSAITPANGSSNTLSPFVQLSSTRT
jgi:HK97 family phage major capsid protein